MQTKYPKNEKEMINYFYKRTRKHIDRVGKYIDKIYKSDPKKYYLLLARKKTHDQSKYTKEEIVPYIYLTWKYHCDETGKKFDLDENTKRQIQVATYHHVKHNQHHPEFHDENTTLESINPKDRDEPPEKIVDGRGMTETDVAEMVADWCSMSEEKGGDPMDWARKNINKRWLFDKNQIMQIYNLLKLYKKEEQK